MYYVYKHINPMNNNTFYIGKGTGKRAYECKGRSPAWKVYVSGLAKIGLVHTVLIVKTFESEFESLEFERSYIREELISGRVLFNPQIAINKEHLESLLIVDYKSEDYECFWNNQSTISLFIRQKRKQLKINQEELADKAGVGLRFIRELEGGKPTVRLDCVNKVLYMFGYELKPSKIIPK